LNQLGALNRREALIAGGSLCLAAAGPEIALAGRQSVHELVNRAIGRRRSLRDGVPTVVSPEIAAANLPLVSHEATLDAAAQSSVLATQAKELRHHRLSADDRDTLECLIWDLERDAGIARFYWHEYPMGFVGSELSTLTLQFLAPPAADQHAPFLQKLGQASAYVDGIRERLSGQLTRKLTAPRAEGVRAYEQSLVEAKEVAATVRRAAQGLAAQNGGASAAQEAQRIVGGPLAEALGRLCDMIRTDYVPALEERAGIIRAPDVDDYFRELARVRVSDELTLEDTNHKARERLAVLDADLAAIRRRLGAPADADAFHRSMSGDPRWFVRSADELKARLEAAIAKVAPLVPRYFYSVPRTPFGVAPLPEALETRLLNGFYLPPSTASPRGTYLYNSSRLEVSNWGWTKPLVAHELLPGHHLQAALRFESKTLPTYRKELFVPAFAEGWGEYARQLMEEAGFYEGDPWGLYAARLVERRFALFTAVETGINEPGWTWQKAEAALATDPLSRPGTTRQLALAAATFRSFGLQYFWGLHRFLRLRRLARSGTMPSFDVRQFHSSIMLGDLVPFSVAERRVRDFVRTAKDVRDARV
jgi:uncharacterized protein (DUF885 family)